MTIATFFAAVDFNDATSASASWAPVDPIEQMAHADRADWTLLRLVMCSAAATLVLALACSLASCSSDTAACGQPISLELLNQEIKS